MHVQNGEALLQRVLEDLKSQDVLPLVHPIFEAHSLAYMRNGNLRALIIHPQSGGWVADILFHDVPPGYPEVVGTLDAKAYPTRKAALDVGVALVRRILAAPIPLRMDNRPIFSISVLDPLSW